MVRVRHCVCSRVGQETTRAMSCVKQDAFTGVHSQFWLDLPKKSCELKQKFRTNQPRQWKGVLNFPSNHHMQIYLLPVHRLQPCPTCLLRLNPGAQAMPGWDRRFFSFSSRSDLPPKSWIFRHARIYTVPFFGFPCCVPTANGIYAYKIRRGILRVATSAAAQKQNWKLSKLPRKPSNRHPQKEFLVHPWALESLRGITRTIDTTEYIKPCHVGRMTICLFGDDRRRLDHVISSLTAKQSAAPRCLTDGKYLCRLEPLPLG